MDLIKIGETEYEQKERRRKRSSTLFLHSTFILTEEQPELGTDQLLMGSHGVSVVLPACLHILHHLLTLSSDILLSRNSFLWNGGMFHFITSDNLAYSMYVCKKARHSQIVYQLTQDLQYMVFGKCSASSACLTFQEKKDLYIPFHNVCASSWCNLGCPSLCDSSQDHLTDRTKYWWRSGVPLLRRLNKL